MLLLDEGEADDDGLIELLVLKDDAVEETV